jgi:hypothetical protein
MMDTFTDAQTLTGMIPVGVTPFAALPITMPAPVLDESTNSPATTPPSSPAYQNDRLSSSTQKSTSTPLHRRFLRSISMSPAIPSPSTPKRHSLAKSQGRVTPVHRKSESPIKLEVGQNAFYFSIELPASKITPKKNGTPVSKATTPGTSKRDGATSVGVGTSTREGSPLKKERMLYEGSAIGAQETEPETPTRRNRSPTKGGRVPTVKELAARIQGLDYGTPTRGMRSPTKHASPVRRSPLRAPFSTPKGNGTATGPATPVKSMSSPLRNHSPVKRSPARALFDTPTKKGTAVTPTTSRPGSSVKRIIERSPTGSEKNVSKLAKKMLSKPADTLRVLPESLVDIKGNDTAQAIGDNSTATSAVQVDPLVETARAAAKARPENIGHLMASLRSINIPATQAEDADRLNASPAPTPLRRASQKLGLGASPSFLRLSTNRTLSETNVDVKAAGSSAPYQEANDTQRKEKQSDTASFEAAERDLLVRAAATQIAEQNRTAAVLLETQFTQPLQSANTGLSAAFDMTRNEQAPQYQYPPLLFPKPEPEPEAKQDELPPPSAKHVRSQELDTSKTRIAQQCSTAQHRRRGTDPSVLLKMQQEMANLEATMRRSAGVVDPSFCGPLNLNELPAMTNSFMSSRRDPTDVRSPGVIGSPRALSRTNSTASSIETVRATMVMSAQSRPQLTTRVSSTPKIPRWKPSGPTSTQTKREKRMAAKQMRNERISGPGTPRSRPSSAASAKSTKSIRTKTTTPRTAMASPTARNMSSQVCGHMSPTSRIPSVTSLKSKTSITAIPLSDQPTPNSSNITTKTAVLRQRLETLKSTQSILQIHDPARSIMAPQPYNPFSDHRPYEEKFASAIDIANRLREWHEEDRKKAEAETPHWKTPVKTPPVADGEILTRTFTKDETKDEVAESCTPEGSPTKHLTPIKESLTPSPPKNSRPGPLSSNPNPPSTPNPSPRFPKSPLPKTPAARNPVLARLKTPANRRASTLDRNATRTPSKAIISSLDRAIDEKIAEDARSGREFTPSGNRVRDLLVARGR